MKKTAEKTPKKKIVKRKVFPNKKDLSFNLTEVIIVMFITIILGMIIGGFVSKIDSKSYQQKKAISNEKALVEFVETYKELKENYYGEINTEKMLGAGIEGMLKYLDDDYAQYLKKDSSRTFNDEMDGEYVGLGVQIIALESGLIKVVEVLPDSPAEKSGIKVDDLIVRVNKLLSVEHEINDIVEEIRGKVGTTFELEILRDEQTKNYEITRSSITLTSVSGKVYEEDNQKVAYLRLSTFAANTTSQFKKLLDKYIEEDKVSAVVIDLRNNTGGHLTIAESMSSLFLKKGEVIYQLKDNKTLYKSKNVNEPRYNLPVIFITNEGSASASEVLVAALKENDQGFIVGKNTYGKSSVQTAKELSDGSSIKYTVKEWLTPKGNSVGKIGIAPDLELELSEEYYQDNAEEKDNQLMEALKQAFERGK